MLSDIDFAARYRQHLDASGRQPKPVSAWDARAAELGAKPLGGSYANAFVSRLDLSDCHTLLDVGCGPGTIGLLLCDRMEHVYGLDHSPAMLEQLVRRAAELGADNVTSIRRAWEEPWHDVPRCDIVVASRAGLVADLDDALAKLNAHARRRVYMTQLAGGHFLDPEIDALLERPGIGLPDHIYALNQLHARGIYATLDYIETPSRLAGAESADAFVQRATRILGELSNEEASRLAAWYARDPERGRRGGAPMRWAMLGWESPVS